MSAIKIDFGKRVQVTCLGNTYFAFDRELSNAAGQHSDGDWDTTDKVHCACFIGQRIVSCRRGPDSETPGCGRIWGRGAVSQSAQHPCPLLREPGGDPTGQFVCMAGYSSEHCTSYAVPYFRFRPHTHKINKKPKRGSCTYISDQHVSATLLKPVPPASQDRQHTRIYVHYGHFLVPVPALPARSGHTRWQYLRAGDLGNRHRRCPPTLRLSSRLDALYDSLALPTIPFTPVRPFNYYFILFALLGPE